MGRAGLAAFWLVVLGGLAPAWAQSPATPRPADEAHSAWRAAGGALLAFGAHELGHLAFNVVFDADPGVKALTVGGLPFFAITHAKPLSRRREYAVAASGLWVQHLLDEAILSHAPGVRRVHAPLRKGILAFDAAASLVYTGAALARTGPPERDTRTMAATLGVDERWVGVLVALPLVFDAVRYVDPGARWAVWSSRGAKAGLVLLLLP
jgi:hypothetical protein